MPGTSVYDVYDAFFQQNLTETTVKEIEEMTRGRNQAWRDLRQGIVSASKVKKVIKGMESLEKYRRRSSYWFDEPEDPVEVVMCAESGYVSDSMQWGSDKKEAALVEYWDEYCSELHETHELLRPGLSMSNKNPLVGVSPDSILRPKDSSDNDSVTLVKVKCPHFARSWEPAAAAHKVGNTRSNGDFYLKPQHDLNYNIQFQLGVLDLEECDLVIYTNKGIHLENIDFEPGFYNWMTSTVDRFVSRYLFEAICPYD